MIDKPIGGYFELELPKGSEYHPEGIKLNSGRHCLEYILRLRKYNKIWIPYYTCESILQPIQKLGLDYGYYRIDDRFEPIFHLDDLTPNEGFVYTNYFGLKNNYIRSLPKHSSIIIDNCQAFFSKPLPWFDTFYSPRKFFGVPDGGYLFTRDQVKLDATLQMALSYDRCAHLLKRIDLGAEEGYADFKENDSELSKEDMMQMSTLTRRILSSVEYEEIDRQRVRNFHMYHEELEEYNILPGELFENIESGPLVYPLCDNNGFLRERLISRRIYVAQYWPNVIGWSETGTAENSLARQLVPLPIDQRYGAESIGFIVKNIMELR